MHQQEQLQDAIRKYRLEREWTWTRLSHFIGMRVSTLHRIAFGKVKPSEISLNRLKKAIPHIEIILKDYEATRAKPSTDEESAA